MTLPTEANSHFTFSPSSPFHFHVFLSPSFHYCCLFCEFSMCAIYHNDFRVPVPGALSFPVTQFIIKFKYLYHFHALMTQNLWMSAWIQSICMGLSASEFPATIFRHFPEPLELRFGHLLVLGQSQRAFKINNVSSYGKYLRWAFSKPPTSSLRNCVSGIRFGFVSWPAWSALDRFSKLVRCIVI